jgi:hypothetical protein
MPMGEDQHIKEGHEIFRSIGKLEGEVSGLRSDIQRLSDSITLRQESNDAERNDIRRQIAELQRWRSRVVGIVVGVSAVAGIAATWLAKALGLK